jgi:hypothetical protein
MKDVDYYNDLILHKKFPIDQIYAIQLETNARNVGHIQSWVNNKKIQSHATCCIGSIGYAN